LAVGTDIFLDARPDQPDDLVAVFDTGGYPAQAVLPDLRRTVQITVRSKSYAVARKKIWQIFSLLDRPENRFIEINNRKMVAQAMQPPLLLERDANNRGVFVFNLAVWTSRD
jgi:hypothetical protein